jgi:hypothetical protein
MSNQFCIALMLCVVAIIFVAEGHEWFALFLSLVAADMVSKS